MAESANVDVTPISNPLEKDEKPITTTTKSRVRKVAQSSRRNKRTKEHKISSPQRPYPRVPLEKAIAVARAIKDKNGGNPGRQIRLRKFSAFPRRALGSSTLFSPLNGLG